MRKHSLRLTLGVFNVFSLIALGLVALSCLAMLPTSPATQLEASVDFKLVVLLQYALYMLVGLRFMQWLYAFIDNTELDKKGAIGFDARWAYLGFGTPWLNLVVPYKIILRLLASGGTDRRSVSKSNGKALVRAWWTMHVVYFFSVPVVLLSLHFNGFKSLWPHHEATFLVFGSIVVFGISRCAHALVSLLESKRAKQRA